MNSYRHISMTWQIIVSALTGGLAGAVVANWLVIRRESAGRRLAFRNQIAVLMADLGDIPDKNHQDIRALYEESRRTVLMEAAKIEADIPCGKRDQIRSARASYRDLNTEKQAQLIQVMSHQRERGFDASTPCHIGTQSFKARMVELLKELHGSAA